MTKISWICELNMLIMSMMTTAVHSPCNTKTKSNQILLAKIWPKIEVFRERQRRPHDDKGDDELIHSSVLLEGVADDGAGAKQRHEKGWWAPCWCGWTLTTRSLGAPDELEIKCHGRFLCLALSLPPPPYTTSPTSLSSSHPYTQWWFEPT